MVLAGGAGVRPRAPRWRRERVRGGAPRCGTCDFRPPLSDAAALSARRSDRSRYGRDYGRGYAEGGPYGGYPQRGSYNGSPAYGYGPPAYGYGSPGQGGSRGYGWGAGHFDRGWGPMEAPRHP